MAKRTFSASQYPQIMRRMKCHTQGHDGLHLPSTGSNPTVLCTGEWHEATTSRRTLTAANRGHRRTLDHRPSGSVCLQDGPHQVRARSTPHRAPDLDQGGSARAHEPHREQESPPASPVWLASTHARRHWEHPQPSSQPVVTCGRRGGRRAPFPCDLAGTIPVLYRSYSTVRGTGGRVVTPLVFPFA